MANSTISNLPELTSPSASDVFPIVHDGDTKKVSLSTIYQQIDDAQSQNIQDYVDPLVANAPLWDFTYQTVLTSAAIWTDHVVAPNNLSIGPFNLDQNTTGYKNTAVGINALSANNVGSGNVAVGYQTLFSNVSGSGNTAIGYNAGYTHVFGTNNTFIGNQAMGSCPTESNVITLGNASIKTLRCQAGTITSLSDERDKKDIVPLSSGLDFINALRPVSFNWNMRNKEKVGVSDIGFIAQELQEVQKLTNTVIPNLVNDANPEQLEASYGKLIPVLVKAIQELSKQVEELKK